LFAFLCIVAGLEKSCADAEEIPGPFRLTERISAAAAKRSRKRAELSMLVFPGMDTGRSERQPELSSGCLVNNALILTVR
jgi:hypothetical protein